MTPDWTNQNRANGQWMLQQLQGLGCDPRPTGRSDQFQAVCPFHDDQNPSLSLNTEKAVFHCFGCGVKGHYGHFVHALKLRNIRVDRSVPLSKSAQQRNRRDLKRKLELPSISVDAGEVETCHERAINHWHHVLIDNAALRKLVCGKYSKSFIRRVFNTVTREVKVDEHCYTSPELTDATVRRFRIGFVPASSVEFVRELRKDFSIETILATGLFRRHGNNGVACALAGRVVYPYLADGRPVYAIGRLTELTPHNAAHSKYFKQYTTINGQCLPLSNPPLFNVDVLEDAKLIFITEGITDAIAACQSGVAAVSPVTISFQRNKLDDIAKQLHGKQVIICNDNEVSGNGARGAERMLDELIMRGVDAHGVQLPRFPDVEKVDVCSFIRDEGGDVFKRFIERRLGITFPIWSC